MDYLSQQTKKWVEYDLDGELVSAKPLKGGISSRLTLIEVKSRNGDTREAVLREYTDTEWLDTEPDIALQEAENLKQAEELSVTTPKLIAFDHKGETATHPSLLMSKVEGQITLNPIDRNKWIKQLALILVRIHEFKNPQVTHTYFRYFDPEKTVKAGWSSRPEEWKKAFRYMNNFEQPTAEQVFIHRDFHPTNVLFENDGVSAVVDWTDACLGAKQLDIGHCRWNLAMMYGQESADLFLKSYKIASPDLEYVPYWDLEAIGNVFTEDTPEVYGGWTAFGLDKLTKDIMIERMDEFLHQALKQVEDSNEK